MRRTGFFLIIFSFQGKGGTTWGMRRPFIPGIVLEDSWLKPYANAIQERLRLYDWRLKEIRREYGSLENCANQAELMGIHQNRETGDWVYREWAPSARGLWLTGDFNNWDRASHPLLPQENGMWQITLPSDSLCHGQKFKVHILGSDGSRMDRIPAYATRVVQDPQTYDFCAEIWEPGEKYAWQHEFDPAKISIPFIYETHVGMAGEEERVHTYREFADNVLPWIAKCHYNVIQIMAIQEHPYYGSFGYHVSSFFAPSSRFGTPEDLKYLVDKAHGLGIAVLLDIVHSHGVKNMAEGLNNFDGSGGQYFHSGPSGDHPDWDSKLFDYGRRNVLAFLLSNLRWWLEEFRFDGFRFDGVTSMLYYHHGKKGFSGYDSYFNEDADLEAIVYLQLANELIQTIRPGAFSIAEDMSGMPGLCRTVNEGGLGFTHRLTMGIPDYWIKLLKETPDEDWSMGEMWHTLTNRRFAESHVAYAESHDQALVGDKTLAFQLMDADMYWNMAKEKQSVVVDRGMALHKMIRLIVMAAGGEGWLNFMGNEFGHPEWIDFPREGNNWSYKYTRRQWSLVRDEKLRYGELAAFDNAMLEWFARTDLLALGYASLIHMDEENKILVFERGGRVFVFNWSGDRAIMGYKLAAPSSGMWKVVLDTDEVRFGGFGRIDHEVAHFTEADSQMLYVYTLPRTAMVLDKC